MDESELRKLVRASPFMPFELHLSDGTVFSVTHRDMLLVSKRISRLALPGLDGEPFGTDILISNVQITHIGPARAPQVAAGA